MHERTVLRRAQGFTLIEMMIVVALLAVIASMAIPNLLSARVKANESAAVTSLKNIAAAQAQLKATGQIDANNNGAGEFGYFAELAGGVGLRDTSGNPSSMRLSPPVLTGNFAIVNSSPLLDGGTVARSGYVFQMWLPSASSVGVPEADNGGVGATAPNPSKAEVLWCCYAWPLSYGNSGTRAYFVNQSGDVMSTKNTTQRYTVSRPPQYSAAYLKGAQSGMASTLAVNATGQDDQVWIVVN